MSKAKQIRPHLSEYSDLEIIDGLYNGDNKAISKIYSFYFPPISRMIINNSGSDDEAKDIFQEAVMVLYTKIRQQEFALSSKLGTFLYAVSRRLWLKQLTRKGNSTNTVDVSDFEDILHVEDDIGKHEEIESKFSQMNLALEQLGEPCSSLLKDFYIGNMSMLDIQEKFGYTNTDNAKTQKYKCLQRLKKLFFKSTLTK